MTTILYIYIIFSYLLMLRVFHLMYLDGILQKHSELVITLAFILSPLIVLLRILMDIYEVFDKLLNHFK